MDTYLETERLALRRFTADDADLLIELASDPAVMRYLTGGSPTAPEVVRERYLPNILGGYEKWGGNFGLFTGLRAWRRPVRDHQGAVRFSQRNDLREAV